MRGILGQNPEIENGKQKIEKRKRETGTGHELEEIATSELRINTEDAECAEFTETKG